MCVEDILQLLPIVSWLIFMFWAKPHYFSMLLYMRHCARAAAEDPSDNVEVGSAYLLKFTCPVQCFQASTGAATPARQEKPSTESDRKEAE